MGQLDGAGSENEIEEDDSAVPTYRRAAANRQRADSDAEISLLLSQLVSTEEGAPRVDRQESLVVSFSECYSLFVCLSILVQNRHKILRSKADFYQLSMVLNSSQAAGKKTLGQTLAVAHQLYRIYRRYQEMCFGPDGDFDKWLDDPEAIQS